LRSNDVLSSDTNDNVENAIKFVIMTLAPVGVESIKEANVPIKKHITDIIPEAITTLL
jgi:hypothetical protein